MFKLNSLLTNHPFAFLATVYATVFVLGVCCGNFVGNAVFEKLAK